MDKNFYTPENIEAYLDNTLSASDKAFFESEIAKDPLLQNEVSLQGDIVSSLKNYRKAELKNRLNNIEVSMAPDYTGAKIAASILLTGLLGFGIYSYFNNTPETQVAIQENKEISVNNTGTESSKNNSVEQNSTTIATESETITAIKENNAANTSSKKITTPSKASGQTQDLHSAPVIVDGFESEQFSKEDHVNLPDGKIAQTTETKSGIDVKIDATTKNKFHYKYFSNKLFLYGSFDSKTYEILELNTYKGKQVYLYYDNSYYQLNANQLDVAPLSKITDNSVIEELNKFNK